MGSFADQIYPVQALARARDAHGAADPLAAANRTADRLCAAAGPAGQWWWHYDARNGAVVERYPVYSVHQHAMAPMALLDLARGRRRRTTRERSSPGCAGSTRTRRSFEDLVDDGTRLVWRKVGRREPRKAARGLGA